MARKYFETNYRVPDYLGFSQRYSVLEVSSGLSGISLMLNLVQMFNKGKI